jgi:hypothetical protein
MGALWIVWAGFIASALAALLFAVARSFGLTRFSPALQLGCLVVDDHRLPLADTLGLLAHFTLGSTVIPAIYALVLPAVGGPGWMSGAVVGLFHGGAVIAALSWSTRLNRCVRAGRIPPPGRFGAGWGRHTAPVIMVAAVAYGAVTGAVLAASGRASANLAGPSHAAADHVATAVHRPLHAGGTASVQMFSMREAKCGSGNEFG